MGRKRGLFSINTGNHSPELTSFLQNWLRPGRVPGRTLESMFEPSLGGPLHPDESASYRTLARILWFTAAGVIAMALAPLYLPIVYTSAGTMGLLLGGGVLAALGVWSYLVSLKKRRPGTRR